MASEPISLRARTIAIVGAGPSGVIAAKYLRAEKAFDKIVLFEQRSRPGGIWNYTADQVNEDLFTIPQTDPRGKNQDPEWKDSSSSLDTEKTPNGTDGVRKTASFLSPMYEELETNIPRGLMGFQDLDWPEESQLFPTHDTVLKYIEEYGKDVQDLVQYETQVINIEPTSENPNSAWTVQTRHLRSKQETTEPFDAVIVANGHFIVPYVPSIPGIEDWNARYPGLITHSKYYRRASDFSGKRVVVVGNSASGADISNQIAEHSEKPVLWSSRSVSLFSSTHGTTDTHRRTPLPPIKSFLPAPSTRGLEFEDGSIVEDVDAIVFATGYFYSLPFLRNISPALITDGSHVNHTYQHIFYTPRPTLSFLALNQRVIPFPLAEAQAAVVARVYAARLSLPSLPSMRTWESAIENEMGNGRNFHLLPFPKDAEYINEMSTWALGAARKEGLENDGKGKVPPIWGAWEFWCRENFPAIRAAFGKLGSERHEVRSIKGVGFDFEEVLRRKREVEEGEKII